MLYKGKGIIPEKLSIVLLCKQMYWDYYTYERQPSWFLDLIRLTNNIDAEYQDKLNQHLERKSRRK